MLLLDVLNKVLALQTYQFWLLQKKFIKNPIRMDTRWIIQVELKTDLNQIWQASDTLMPLDEIIQNDTPKRTQNENFTNPLALTKMSLRPLKLSPPVLPQNLPMYLPQNLPQNLSQNQHQYKLFSCNKNKSVQQILSKTNS